VALTPDQAAEIIKGLSRRHHAALLPLLEAARARHAAELDIAANRARWAADPVLWINDRLREHVWSKQAEIMGSLRVHRRTAVRSSHGVGKSHIASRAAAYWLDVHEPGEAFVVSTAPTFPQVRAILWRYIGQAHRRGDLTGRVNQTEWHIGNELVGYGRKPADHDEGGFQGIHARKVLVIIDEACGVPEQLWHAADALTTNDGCRILAIGNPDNPASFFRSVCDSPFWHTIGISAYDSPNLTGENVPAELAELLISRTWVEEKLAEWGADSPLFLSKVLGEFPVDDPDKTIRWSDLVACQIPPDEPYAPADLTPVELGVDVAGGGRDETVIRERRGSVAGREWTHREDDPEKVAAHVVAAVIESGATCVRIDSTGIGWGVVGLIRRGLRDLGHTSVRVVAVNASSKAVANTARDSAGRPVTGFDNVRAEMWWNGRELARTGRFDLSEMANADTTLAQLAEPRWNINPESGRIRIEAKDDVISRLGRSPDNADALLLAFYEPVGQGKAFTEAWRNLKAAREAAAEEPGPTGPRTAL
jgi:hypothetical protein